MSLSAKTAYFARAALQGIRYAPFVHFIAVMTIAIALFTAGLARGGAQMLDGLIASIGGEVELTVYLKGQATDDEAKAVAAALSKATQGEAKVVPSEVALARLAADLGDLGSTLSDLPENPLPISVEVKVPAAFRGPGALRALATQARQLPGVTAVDYGEDAVERLSAIAKALRYGGLVAFVLVVVVTVIIISATLQLAIYSRREEIEIQKLVGATDRFAKIPFLLEGLAQGLLGALLAVGGLWGFWAVAGPRLLQLLSFLSVPRLGEHLLDPMLALQLVALGCGLGLAGSFVAVGRFLRV
jgi:cell division transport system permease protein